MEVLLYHHNCAALLLLLPLSLSQHHHLGTPLCLHCPARRDLPQALLLDAGRHLLVGDNLDELLIQFTRFGDNNVPL